MIPMEIHMAAIKQRADKVDRHRQRMRAAGFRPVQFWVPDTRGADFAERVRQQCLKLKGDPAELDALRFVEEAAAQRSEEHTSELQSLMRISYAVFCLYKNKNHQTT